MIILNDKPIEEYGLYTRPDDIHLLSPDVDTTTVKIAGKHGDLPVQSRLGSRIHKVPLAVLTDSMRKSQVVARNFVSVLFDEFARPRTLKLSYKYEPDKFYWVEIDNNITPDRIIGFNDFFVYFVSHDPFAYAQVSSNEVVWGSKIITFEFDYLMGHKATPTGYNVVGETEIPVQVEGYAVEPVFIITGTAKNLLVKTKYHSFILPDFENSTWEIDYTDYTIKQDGKDTMIDSMYKFFLYQGVNDIEIFGSNIDIDITIKYRDKYV